VAKLQLYRKLEEIKLQLDSGEWKYYHLASIENFIYHLESFSSEKTKDRMAMEIEKYLELVSEKAKVKSDIHKKGKELFPNVWKIADTYKYEIGFIQRPSYIVVLILSVGLFFVLKISVSTAVAVTICAFLAVLYTVYSYLKTKARKVW
jgi:hypothetical protein